jgi:acetyl-CoA carboxylase biotin carboxylase subunit
MEIHPFYDSLLAKLIVHDSDRPAAIERALRALSELQIEGVTSTIGVIREIIDSEEFRLGNYSTSFIAEVAGRLPALLKE